MVPEHVPEAAHKYWPADVPHIGYHECAEMSSQYIDTNGFGTAFSNTSFNGHQALMRRAYYGCLGYVDSLIGQVLAVLDKKQVADVTAVSFIGDHGILILISSISRSFVRISHLPTYLHV